MKTKIVIEKREVTHYVAEDGTEFKTEKDCLNYEVGKNREKLLSDFEKIERADLNMAPPGLSYVDTERYDYIWFRPKDKCELDVLNKYFGLKFPEKCIGDWVGVEVEGNYDDYDSLSSDDCWTLDYKGAFIAAKEFFEALGYKVTIEPANGSDTSFSKEKDDLIHFVSGENDYGVVFANQLRALWTALCIHENLDVDTHSYDNALNEVWCALVANDNKLFKNFDAFDNFMCEYMV